MKLSKPGHVLPPLTDLQRLNIWKVALLLLTLALSGLANTAYIKLPTSPWLATVLAFVTVLLLPGFLLSGLIFRKEERSWPEQLPVAFVLGIAMLSLPAVLLLQLQANLAILAWLATVINLGLGGLIIWNSYRKGSKQETASSRKMATELVEQLNPILLGAGLLATIGIIYLYWSTASTWSFGDNWAYLRYIRLYLDQSLSATVSTLPEYEGILGTFSPRALFNGWWVLQALMYRVAGFEAIDIYSFYFPPVLLVISILAFYSLAQELFRDRNIALLALLVQVLYYLSSISSHDWIGRGFFDRIIEDKFLIWLIILPVTQLLMLRYLRTGYKSYLLSLALGMAALTLTHPLGLVQGGLSLGAFIFLYVLLSPQRFKIIKQVATFSPLLLLLLVPLSQRQMLASGNLAFGYADASESQFILSQTRLWVFSALDNSYMAHPQLIAHPLTILAILLTPLLIQYLKKDVAAQFLFSNMAMTLLLLYNPITAPLLGRLITPWMLWRISWLLPVSLTVSYFLAKIGHWMQQALPETMPSTRHPYVQSLIPILLIMLTGLSLQGYIVDGLRVLQERRVKTMTESEREVLVYLREQVTPGSTIVANSVLNTYIPAFTSSARVLTFRFRGKPSTIEAINNFHHQRLVTQSTLDLLERWDTKYIIIERNHDLASQFGLLSQMFVKRYQNAAYELYQVVSYHPANYVITGNTYLSQGEPEQAMAAYKQALAFNFQDPLAHYGLGQVYLAQDKVTSAKAAYIQAVNSYPTYLPARLALARLYAIEGDLTAAMDQYQAINKLQPDYRVSFEELGDLYLARGQEYEAFEQYQQAIEAPAKTGEYYLRLANLCQAKGLTDQAIEAYQNTLALEPRSERAAAAYFGLASLNQAEGRLSEAIFVYQQGTSLTPNYRDNYLQLANLYLAEDYLDKTKALYQDAARRNLNSAWPHLELGKIYLAQMNLR